jgi:hypothetical protein
LEYASIETVLQKEILTQTVEYEDNDGTNMKHYRNKMKKIVNKWKGE